MGRLSTKFTLPIVLNGYCPYRIITELVGNDRIVGGLTTKASKLAADFYRTFVSGDIFETTARTAELCKLTENSFRDVNIAFANELSLICDKEKINVWNLIDLANRHPRVSILKPGPGVGGHCIAVDPWFIVSKDAENSKLIKTAREVNNNKTAWVIDEIKNAALDFISLNSKKPIIACFGLSFKPDVDDLRESPALEVALKLQSAGYHVLAVEPNIDTDGRCSVVGIDAALNQADIFAVLVKHQQFKVPNVQKNYLKNSV